MHVARCFTFIKLSMASCPLACVRLVKIHSMESTPLLNRRLTMLYPMPLLPPVTNTKGPGTFLAQLVNAETARVAPFRTAVQTLCCLVRVCATVKRATKSKCVSACALYEPLREVERKLTNNIKGTLNRIFVKRLMCTCALMSGYA